MNSTDTGRKEQLTPVLARPSERDPPITKPTIDKQKKKEPNQKN